MYDLLKKIIITVILTLNFFTKAYAFNENQSFSYYAEEQQLSEVLSSFARSQHLVPSFSQQISGTLSGKFENVPAKDFLNSMREAFGIAWYTSHDMIYFYNQNEVQKAFITTKVIPAKELLSMLQSTSIIAKNLPIEVMPNSDMLVVSGPPNYLAQVQSAITAFESAQTSNFVMEVFPLKFAWADDISITSMDTQITIPGIASILRAMVTGSNSSPSTTTQLPSTVPALLGQGLSANGQASSVAQSPQPLSQNQSQSQAAGPINMVNIIADPRVNSVIITDAAYRMSYYRQVIEDLDKPVELVEIHAAIVDIDSDYNRNLGVDFQGSIDLGGGETLGGSSSGQAGTIPLPNPGDIVSGGLSTTLYSLGSEFFIAQVQALEQDNAARILGKPSVLTMDNVQATLENTSTYYVEVGGKDVADLFKVEAGTILKVTPHIINHPDESQSIKLVVNVQDNQGDDSSTTAVGALPPIKQTKINTQAIVNEGQSLLIGGYYYEQTSEGDSGIPIIKNIPLLGNLFKSSSKKTQKMERLILITPKVVRLNEEYQVPERLDEKSFSRTPTQAHYEERIIEQQATGSGCSRKTGPKNPTN